LTGVFASLQNVLRLIVAYFSIELSFIVNVNEADSPETSMAAYQIAHCTDAEDHSVNTKSHVFCLFQSAAFVSRFRSNWLRYSLNSALRATNHKVWTTKTAGEFLFDGYSDPLLTAAALAPSLSQTTFTGSKFAWFYKRNDSFNHDGVYNIETGEEDVSKLGIVRSWNYKNHSDFFESDCGQVKGTIGDLFPPGLKKNTPLQMFAAEICR